MNMKELLFCTTEYFSVVWLSTVDKNRRQSSDWALGKIPLFSQSEGIALLETVDGNFGSGIKSELRKLPAITEPSLHLSQHILQKASSSVSVGRVEGLPSSVGKSGHLGSAYFPPTRSHTATGPIRPVYRHWSNQAGAPNSHFSHFTHFVALTCNEPD